MGPCDRARGPRHPSAPASLLRQPARRGPALAADRPGGRGVRRLAPLAVDAARFPAGHAARRPARRGGRLVPRAAAFGRGFGRRRPLVVVGVGRRGEARRHPVLGLDRGFPPHPGGRPGDPRRREVHGSRLPELARALPGDAAGRSLDGGQDDQLLLLGLPARGRAGPALRRGAADRVQPLRRDFWRLLLRRGGGARAAPLEGPARRRSRRGRRRGLRRQPGRRPRCLERAVCRRLRLLARLPRDRSREFQDDQRVPLLHVLPRGPASAPAGISLLHRRLRGRAPLGGGGQREGDARVAVDAARRARGRHGARGELLEPAGDGDPPRGVRRVDDDARRARARPGPGNPRRPSSAPPCCSLRGSCSFPIPPPSSSRATGSAARRCSRA